VLNAGEGALQVLQVDDDWVRHNLLQAEHYYCINKYITWWAIKIN
jgi:hypothetical protein